MRTLTLILILALTFGCDGGGDDDGNGGTDTIGGEDTIGGQDTTVDASIPDGDGDTTPPEFRDVRVEIHAAPSIPLDLNNQDVERVLPMAFPATFTVFTTDDESDAEAIVVTILSGEDDTPVVDQEASFSNGLWTVDVPSVAPGETFRVQVDDEAGNTDVWTYALMIPTIEEALVGDWDTRFYDAEGAHMHSYEASWLADGTWTETEVDPDDVLGGSWSVDGDLITVDITTRASGDDDPETVERRDESGFYVDETYFATWPLERVGEGNGLAGTWTRAVKVWEDTGQGQVLTNDETHTIDLEDGGALTVTIAGFVDGVEDQTEVITGTWVLVPNENYIENYGDYLVLTVDTIDGEPMDEPDTWVDLMVIRHELLLLAPKVRSF